VAVSVNVEVVRVAAFIGSLKVAVTGLVAITLVVPLVGVTEVTVGTIPFAVVKLHVKGAGSGPPRELVAPVPIVAV
jgi:hypothetical protein